MSSDSAAPAAHTSPVLESRALEHRRQAQDGDSATCDAATARRLGTDSGAATGCPSPHGTAPKPQVSFRVPEPADDGSVAGETDMTSVVYVEPEAGRQQQDGDPDSEDDRPASIYATKRYPAVPDEYQVDRPYDATTLTSSSRSLYDDEVHYTYENGRRYWGDYMLPNDELEQDRMRILHQVHLYLFEMELTTVPLENPTCVLDIGTGTGEWALGMAELFPDCEIIGTDVSAIQPTSVPYKVFFELDDAEQDWMRPRDSMDLVHLRGMSGAFSDWSFIYKQAHYCLKPGGYVEVLDFFWDMSPDSLFLSHFEPTSPLFELLRDMALAEQRTGKPAGTSHINTELMVDAGFTDVEIHDHSIQLNPIQDPLGKLWLLACLYSFEATSLRLLTRYMGWTAERVSTACDAICAEFKSVAFNPAANKDFSVALRVATARKPLFPGQWSALNVHENGNVDYGGESSTAGDSSTVGESTIGSGSVRGSAPSQQGVNEGQDGSEQILPH